MSRRPGPIPGEAASFHDMSSPATLLRLPLELLVQIASYLSTRDVLCSLACASRFTHSAVTDFAYARHVRYGPAGAAPLWWAARKGLLEPARRALAFGADPNEHTEDAVVMRGQRNTTPLAAAVFSKDVAMVKLLLEHGAHPGCLVYSQTTLTHAAAEGSLDIARLLLEQERRDWNPSMVRRHPCDDSQPQFASKLVHLRNSIGSSALHQAAEAGDEDMARLLLSYGARVDSRDIQGLTPLCVAIKNNHLATARLLLEAGADPLAIDYQGKRCPLSIASRLALNMGAKAQGPLAFFKLLLSATMSGSPDDEASDGAEAQLTLPTELLHDLLSTGTVPVIDAILALGADPDTRSTDGSTPLLRRARNKPGERDNAPAVWKLLDFGASLEATLPGQPETPLLYAIEKRQDEVVQVLVARGASLTARDKDGRDPLLKAISLDRRWVTHLLLDSGVAVETMDSYGTSALALAAGSGMHGISARLLELGAVLETKDKLGRTPLVWAVESENLEDMRLLLDHGAAVDVVYSHVDSPDGETVSSEEAGTSEPVPIPRSRTPLNTAVRNGSLDSVQALLKAGADLQLARQLDPAMLQCTEQADEAEALVNLLRAVRTRRGNMGV
ncbi:ankyrin repeat-containing domain protein [Microdochium trichocladiopsis]|uniref:Ankyrin repeat-containing domain protein n=1 Tax=Microdochium trichocladiopsis TaxID=1682393 RepID=A0A9P8Y378_9PEZI|nr:ankyrin repeat-containing domain protein [Microdochium trichocladiopsis]KAH7028772.1 ankyrin repeat-containing domain protein [Microdochium trichocladiopsis]